MMQYIWLIPVILMILITVIRTWRNSSRGLFFALLKLVGVAASAAGAYALTRLFVNPGTTDVMGLGEKLVQQLPEEARLLGGDMEAMLRALPTAMIALLVFCVAFFLLKLIICGILSSLDRRHRWSEKVLAFRGNKAVAVLPGLAAAVLCLLAEWVLLNGLLGVSSGVLSAVGALSDVPQVQTVSTVVRELAESPAIKLTDAMGCRQAFYALTTAEKDGKAFSVGEELVGMSKLAGSVEKLSSFLPGSDKKPTGDDFRELGKYFEENPEAVDTAFGLLGDSAAELLGQVIPVTPELVEEYLNKIQTVTTQEDITIICNIAGILADRGLLFDSVDGLDMEAREDPQLRELVKNELLKSENLSALFDLMQP